VLLLGLATIPVRAGDARPPVNAGRSGKRLPNWVRAALQELLQEVPSLPDCPAGFTAQADDIVLVEDDGSLKALLTPAQYRYVVTRRPSTFVAEHHFPLFLLGDSPDLQFLQALIRNGMYDQAVHLAKAILAHEVMHVRFDPKTGLSEQQLSRLTVEEFERRHELAAYELQLFIVRRDLAAGKYAAMFEVFRGASIDLTRAIEEKLTALRAGAPMHKFHFFESSAADLVH